MRSEQILQRPDPQVANSPQPRGCKFPRGRSLRQHLRLLHHRFTTVSRDVFGRSFTIVKAACPRLPIACQAACPCRPRGSKETRNVVGKIDEKRDDQFAEDRPRDERLRSLDRDHAGILHHPLSARDPEGGGADGGHARPGVDGESIGNLLV